jgi:diacylglycerol kinase family enzyme
MDAFLLINPHSGRDRSPEELRAAAERRGIATHFFSEGEDITDVARAAGADVLGVAGGDGSIGLIAGVAIERGLPLVVVPFGTRNHFARDLGLDPANPIAELDAFEGNERRIDAGRVNGRLFVNNVSVGIYALLVRERERDRRRHRAVSNARALLLALRHPRPTNLSVDGAPPARLVFVSNNEYQPDLFAMRGRQRLDSGRLSLYQARGLLPTDWEQHHGTEFRVDAPRVVRAAIDGEPTELQPPLHFRSEPGALRVLLPREPGS